MRLTLFVAIVMIGLAVARAAPEPTNMQQLLSNGISNFTVELMKYLHRTAEPGQNLIFSPSNIYFTLSMLHLGSAGATRNQIAQTLGMPVDDAKVPQIHETVKDMLQSIQYKDEYSLGKSNIANGVFLQKGLELKPSYNADSQKYYNSVAENLDFQKEGQATVDKINKWCSDKTEGRIPKVFDAPLDPSTLVVLASALYFNGRWKNEFSPSKTKTGKFDNGVRKIDVQMMNADESVPYINDDDLKFEAIALNYDGYNFSMGIYLPHAGVSLKTLTQNLKTEHLQHVFSAKYRPVDYKIPRTKFSHKTSLTDALTSLGLGQLFSKVDLSNMINMAAADSLKIGEAKHIAEIEIDEEGTTASAITFLPVFPTSGYFSTQPSIPFYADRPFLLAIQHRPTKTIMFVGAVYQPVENTA